MQSDRETHTHTLRARPLSLPGSSPDWEAHSRREQPAVMRGQREREKARYSEAAMPYFTHGPDPSTHRITNYASNVRLRVCVCVCVCVCVLYIWFSYLPEKERQKQVVKVFTSCIVKTRLCVWHPGNTWRCRHARLYLLTAAPRWTNVEKHINGTVNTCVQRQLLFCNWKAHLRIEFVYSWRIKIYQTY